MVANHSWLCSNKVSKGILTISQMVRISSQSVRLCSSLARLVAIWNILSTFWQCSLKSLNFLTKQKQKLQIPFSGSIWNNREQYLDRVEGEEEGIIRSSLWRLTWMCKCFSTASITELNLRPGCSPVAVAAPTNPDSWMVEQRRHTSVSRCRCGGCSVVFILSCVPHSLWLLCCCPLSAVLFLRRRRLHLNLWLQTHNTLMNLLCCKQRRHTRGGYIYDLATG